MVLAHPLQNETPGDRPWTRRALLAVTGFSAVNAIAGGVGLVLNGLGVPPELLESTPFNSFTGPGLLLAGVVGGAMTSATVAAWRRSPRAGEVAIVAGTIMLGWIVVESWMITDGRPLQVAVAVMSIATILLGWRQRRLDRVTA